MQKFMFPDGMKTYKVLRKKVCISYICDTGISQLYLHRLNIFRALISIRQNTSWISLIINVKYMIHSSDFNQSWGYLAEFSKRNPNIILAKIRLSGAESPSDAVKQIMAKFRKFYESV